MGRAENCRVMSMAERKRLLVRDQLGDAALKLLAAQGFDNTTIDEIVAAAGVSRRTFFRYFKSKEDVIIEFTGDIGDFICDELASRPADEPVAKAIKQALATAAGLFTEHPEKSIALAKLVRGSSALNGRYLDRQSQSAQKLGRVLAERAGLPADDPRSHLAAVMSLAAFDFALVRWAEMDGAETLDSLIDQAMTLGGEVLAG